MEHLTAYVCTESYVAIKLAAEKQSNKLLDIARDAAQAAAERRASRVGDETDDAGVSAGAAAVNVGVEEVDMRLARLRRLESSHEDVAVLSHEALWTQCAASKTGTSRNVDDSKAIVFALATLTHLSITPSRLFFQTRRTRPARRRRLRAKS